MDYLSRELLEYQETFETCSGCDRSECNCEDPDPFGDDFWGS